VTSLHLPGSLHAVEAARGRFGTFAGPVRVPAPRPVAPPIAVPPPDPDGAQGWRASPADLERFASDPPQVDLLDDVKGQFPYKWMFMPYGYLAYGSPPGQHQDADGPHGGFEWPRRTEPNHRIS
jgi:hypothetical protein